MKCEPSAYSIDDLEKERITSWEGVRNFQARNFLRDKFDTGDIAFFYHSNAAPSGIVGLMKIAKKGYPDFTALNPKHKYYDPNSSQENPIWYMVDVEFIKKFPQIISLQDLRNIKGLEQMEVLKKGSRLSVQPVKIEEFNSIMRHYGY